MFKGKKSIGMYQLAKCFALLKVRKDTSSEHTYTSEGLGVKLKYIPQQENNHCYLIISGKEEALINFFSGFLCRSCVTSSGSETLSEGCADIKNFSKGKVELSKDSSSCKVKISLTNQQLTCVLRVPDSMRGRQGKLKRSRLHNEAGSKAVNKAKEKRASTQKGMVPAPLSLEQSAGQRNTGNNHGSQSSAMPSECDPGSQVGGVAEVFGERLFEPFNCQGEFFPPGLGSSASGISSEWCSEIDTLFEWRNQSIGGSAK